jgi:hypothetical protein
VPANAGTRTAEHLLSPRENAKQETQAGGYRHRGNWILPDGVFGIARRLRRLVLRAAELLIDYAADGRRQALNVCADSFNLVRQSDWVIAEQPRCYRARSARGGLATYAADAV